MKYFVEIVETSTGKVEKRIDAGTSLRAAERCENGVMINMNHGRFHTEIVTYKGATSTDTLPSSDADQPATKGNAA